MKTDAEWRLWGKKDPLFGVAVAPGKQRGGDKPWTDEEFYSLGFAWDEYRKRWSRYARLGGTVAEIGCGAGRITKRLAADFSKVIACDVSEGMLRYGREHIRESNIDWRLSDGNTLPADTGSLDAVFSCHVFQHFESPEAQLRYFREIHRALKPGGSFFIHLPVHAFPWSNPLYGRIGRIGYRLFLRASDVKAAIKRWRMNHGGPLYMHGVSSEMDVLHQGLVALGFVGVEFVTFQVASQLNTCVVGTRA